MPKIIINAEQPKLFSTVPDVKCKIQAPGKLLVPDIPEGYYDMTPADSYLGINPRVIKTVTPVNLTLDNTSFAAWTASTTASSIWSNPDVIDTITIAPTEHDYIVRWKVTTIFAYNSGATLKVIPITHVGYIFYDIFRYSSNITNVRNQICNAQLALALRTEPAIAYYASSGAAAINYASYGVYPVAVAPTFSSSSAATPTLNLKLPSLSARCSTTYMAVARKEEINTTNTHIKIEGEVIEVNYNTCFGKRSKGEVTEVLRLLLPS